MTVEPELFDGAAWYEVFPFNGEFMEVAERAVSLEYVEQLVCVLEPAVKLFEEAVEKGDITEMTVRVLMYAANALARCRVAQSYASEIKDDRYSRASLLSAMEFEWQALLDRECMMDVAYAASVEAVLGPSIRVIWAASALQTLSTAQQLCDRFPAYVAETRVVAVSQVLVANDRGVPLRQMLAVHGDKPLLTADAYAKLLVRAKQIDFDFSVDRGPVDILAGATTALDIVYGVLPADVVAAWLWVLLASFGEMRGYCYQFLCAPAQRYALCCALRQNPVVDDLLVHLRTLSSWSGHDAVVVDGDVLHVDVGGSADLLWLAARSSHTIGMLRDMTSAGTDYYAKALVDEFITKYKPLPVVPSVPPPLDTAFETLSVSSDSGAGREFVDVANLLYQAVEERMSPRAEAGGARHASVLRDLAHVDERDSETVREIYNRLNDGAVIYESYFERTYRRMRRLHRRPRMDRSDGRLYHVFEGFPAEGGSGLGPWELDMKWGIPGWQSYTAYFSEGEKRTVSFTVEGGCQDVRMDCSGSGALDFGDCMVRIDGTLLWFTNSIRFCVTAKEAVCLRISVPDARVAVAMGAEMRRYMHIPGYAVVARSYDVIPGLAGVVMPMTKLKAGSIAGCHVHAGNGYVDGGRHRIKLSQVASLAPARLLFKTEPPEALDHVSICGMRLHPRARDYVAALVDLRNVDMYVVLHVGATLHISCAQIVRTKEFELAVVSTAGARAARTSADMA